MLEFGFFIFTMRRKHRHGKAQLVIIHAFRYNLLLVTWWIYLWNLFYLFMLMIRVILGWLFFLRISTNYFISELWIYVSINRCRKIKKLTPLIQMYELFIRSEFYQLVFTLSFTPFLVFILASFNHSFFYLFFKPPTRKNHDFEKEGRHKRKREEYESSRDNEKTVVKMCKHFTTMIIL